MADAPRFVPLALERADRDLLATLAFWAGEGLQLEPWQNRRAQKLASMGLCEIDDARAFASTFGHYVSFATIAAPGWRVVNGPRLAAIDGLAVDYDTPLPWSVARGLVQQLYRRIGGDGFYTPDTIVERITNPAGLSPGSDPGNGAA